MNELLPPLPSSLQTSPPVLETARLVESFFQNRRAGTMKAYRQDLESFKKYVGANSIEEAAQHLLVKGSGPANAMALSFKDYLWKLSLAPASINRKLAALRSLVKLGRVIGVVSFTLEVKDLEVEGVRNTRGPGTKNVEKMLALAQLRQDKKGKRDYCILRVLFDLGLRRGELCSLDVSHIDLEEERISVMGKGRHQRQWLTLADETRDALSAWLKVRGEQTGALFLAVDPRTNGQRLGGEGVARVVDKLGQKIGLSKERKVKPHGLRHAAITKALDATNGDLRRVQKFSRHKSLEMLLVYDDAREDFQGQISKLVAKSSPRNF